MASLAAARRAAATRKSAAAPTVAFKEGVNLHDPNAPGAPAPVIPRPAGAGQDVFNPVASRARAKKAGGKLVFAVRFHKDTDFGGGWRDRIQSDIHKGYELILVGSLLWVRYQVGAIDRVHALPITSCHDFRMDSEEKGPFGDV